jgi:GWxTD domain-containing protein
VRSSSICCAASREVIAAAFLACLAVAGLAGAGCSGAGVGGSTSAATGELVNPQLGPDFSAWLIGPVEHIATADEVKAYLALRDDGEAADFIQRFWERRNPRPGSPNPLVALFDERGAVADQRFTEAGVLGRRTDRGTVLVLYGAPVKTGFAVSPRPTDPPIEVWEYGAGAAAGLDGKRPQAIYRFTKRGDLTVLYVPRPGARIVPRAAPP